MSTISYTMEGQYEPIEFRYGGPLVKEVFRENRILSQELIGQIEGNKTLGVGFHAWTQVAPQDALLQAAVYSPEEHFKGSEGMQLKDITYFCDSIEDVMDQLVGYANSMEAQNCVSTTIISHSEPAVHINERMAMRIEAAYYPQWKAFYSPYLR